MTSSPAIKHFYFDLRLRCFLPKRIFKIDAEVLGVHLRAEVVGGRRALHRYELSVEEFSLAPLKKNMTMH